MFVGAPALLATLTLSITTIDAFGFLSMPQVKPSLSVGLSNSAVSRKASFRAVSLRSAPAATSMSMKAAQGGLSLKYTAEDGANIEYDFLPGRSPTVFYLPAFNQTKYGSKAAALQTWCKRNKQVPCTRGCHEWQAIFNTVVLIHPHRRGILRPTTTEAVEGSMCD